ncbi:RNA polymerase sigma-70 factor [Niastella caeni]|uniref:RNA polymerase sigma-70 factor n=1 Tax=Niastella caeni TaxID=2569763 RepID=A0A4S8HVI3_9BACT|nr:RNA polymerase sigma-70 factor [Niastella caeni]THU39201.1 RNA polymerase sigma-70 factor [Niastella caeni]
MDDNQFLTPAENGQPFSFKDVFNELYPWLCFYAQSLVSSKDEAQDIVAECFAKLYGKMDAFKSKGDIKNYLVAIIKNACISYLRKQKTKIKYDNYLKYIQPFSEDNMELPAYEAEIIQKLYLEIDKLPEKMKQVFKLTYLERIPRDEVARLLNISPNTVKGHNARAMELLRIAFKDKDLIILLIIISCKIFKN